MRNLAYLHSTNGQNCFVGDIHFGDVVPGKSPTCAFFPDPFAAKTIPRAVPCSQNHVSVTVPSTLFPGIYCAGLSISATTTLNKGVYIIKGGALSITGALTNVTANGVTFILTGGAALNINTTGTINLSPSSAADGGSFAGFAIYSDQAAPPPGGNAQKGGSFTISAANVNLSGIIYAAGQTFIIDQKANVTISPGSIIADYLLPDDANLTLTGTLSSSDAAAVAMRKPADGVGTAILVH